MRIVVLGLWHLGCVTAACMARAGHQVTGLDPDPGVVEGLARGRAPLSEPGLDGLIAEGLKRGNLSFGGDPAAVLASGDLLWVAFDTPVDEDDRADTEWVVERVRECFPHLKAGSLIMVSSQLPVGSAAALQAQVDRARAGAGIRVCVSPENLRLGGALEAFLNPDRVVAGVPDAAAREAVAELFRPVTGRVEWMSPASAEMTKHAINAFLALSVVFINEIAGLCERTGADAREVERGLKSESRIGPKAYLGAGSAFAGGTLARDLVFLDGIARREGGPGGLFASALESNARHRGWPRQALESALGTVRGRRVAVLGMAYKPGTSTLRRSEGLELCRWLLGKGARVSAADPLVESLPGDFGGVALSRDWQTALEGAEALVVMNSAPEWKGIRLSDLAGRNPAPRVVDPSGLLADQAVPAGLEYLRVGLGRRRA